MDDNPRFVIVGPGALGSVVAARLARAEIPVALLGRDSAHLRAIREDGLTLLAPDGGSSRHRLAATDDPRVVVDADAIVVLVKTVDTETAMRAIAPYLHTDQTLVTMQNGLGGVERIRAVVGGGPRVLPAVTWQAATRLAPGVVRHAGEGPTAIGFLENQDREAAERVAAAFTTAALAATVEPDIEPVIWRKAAVNAAINGLTALGEVPNGSIAGEPVLKQAAAILAGEVASVALARGYPLGQIDEAVVATAVASAHNRSSMLQDLEAGRPTEVEAIHGAVLRAAAALGVATPALAVVTALIRAKEHSRQLTGDQEHR